MKRKVLTLALALTAPIWSFGLLFWKTAEAMVEKIEAERKLKNSRSKEI